MSTKRTFSGLRSLWIMWFSWSTSRPSNTYKKMLRAVFSENCKRKRKNWQCHKKKKSWNEKVMWRQTFWNFTILSNNSPPSTNSVTITKWSVVRTISWRATSLSCRTPASTATSFSIKLVLSKHTILDHLQSISLTVTRSTLAQETLKMLTTRAAKTNACLHVTHTVSTWTLTLQVRLFVIPTIPPNPRACKSGNQSTTPDWFRKIKTQTKQKKEDNKPQKLWSVFLGLDQAVVWPMIVL